MPSRLPFAFLVFASLALGCADSHEGSGPADGAVALDGARAVDASELPRCDRDVGPIGPPFACVQGHGPICSDALVAPSCVGGDWVCPAGSTPEPLSSCRCFGAPPPGCACGDTGWECDDRACPIDFVTAEGTACSEEGRSCGRCTDSCGFCNVLSCEGGVWVRLEAHPLPPPCTPFECGPELRCAAEREHCEVVLSDVPGYPDDYRCRLLPDGCRSCSCMPDPGSCTEDPEGGITITYPGG